MNSNDLRIKFLDFFAEKNHTIIPSAPMVIRHDPTLMFTNAGMNQFKDIFLGNTAPKYPRIADSQKCLRVSGKHNDLEQVGHDTYHHTMFEMLGNWSFGDYFKQEAIEWAWEFLTKVLEIPEDRLYVTFFEGSKEDKMGMDEESLEHWKKFLPEAHILPGSRKDNFWEMGDSGPCGPCSEIHCDIRDEHERERIPGHTLVNAGNPLLIEIWNLVFIQYNRKSDGSLELLPQRHVDTGMGFERLCMVVQGKKSTYDTDLFVPLIQKTAEMTGIRFGDRPESDTAMRVLSDHIRAISFAVADGQLPTNTRAGYVIRRILRRAARYAFTFLNQKEPCLFKLVPELVNILGDPYPELKSQKDLIENVIREEENSFLRTLETGIRMLDQLSIKALAEKKGVLSGRDVFTLYDTYGFPPDLTQLIVNEKNLSIDAEGFEKEMEMQKSRSKTDAAKETGDWILTGDQDEVEFTGYDSLEAEVKIIRFRKVQQKGENFFQLVFDKTPFYAESGGQVGDTGFISHDGTKIKIINTLRENNLVIHLTRELPGEMDVRFLAVVDRQARINTENNHTATHLLHYALRQVLGSHVEQKGSLVHPDYLRFDFSYFKKVGEEDLRQVELMVNRMIRENIQMDENRHMSFADARKLGAMALFGEKYGEVVRVVRFGQSIELCGGTHVSSTGRIGIFKILKESAIAAGIRRIEAVSGEKAEQFLLGQLESLKKTGELLGAAGDPVLAAERIVAENNALKRQIEVYEKERIAALKKDLAGKFEQLGELRFLAAAISTDKAATLRDIAFMLKSEGDDLFVVLGAETGGKASLAVLISEKLVETKNLNASVIVRDISAFILGSGGGQAFFATAGGKDPEGIQKALEMARKIASEVS